MRLTFRSVLSIILWYVLDCATNSQDGQDSQDSSSTDHVLRVGGNTEIYSTVIVIVNFTIIL